MLIGHFEITEDEEEHEQVVDAERQLNHITSDELDGLRPAVPEQLQDRECGCQRDPEARPRERFAETDAVGAAIQDTQDERQHRDHNQVKKNPEQKHRKSYGKKATGVRCRKTKLLSET